MNNKNCLVLTQYREGEEYNDFIGKFYHFPASENKSYLRQFENLPIEIVYYEPEKSGKGVFYGYGEIIKQPFVDKTNPDYYFVEISNYKPFSTPVYFKNDNGEIIEKIANPSTYNSSNSVRKITHEFLDDLCLDGGILLNFTADAHLVQVLGEQLIASERVGILELVKNAIDAGATYCNVTIEKIPTPELPILSEALYNFNKYEGPVIIIEDNGSGMTRHQIESGWLRPASTIKTSIKERLKQEREKAEKNNTIEVFETYLKLIKVENRGRIPLGEKGVGRFASHRLGKNLIIKTKVEENSYELVLRIDWDKFNIADGSSKDLDEIKISLTREPLSRDYGVSNSGTQLIIFGGREGFELDEAEIREINKTILKLNSPNPNPDSDLGKFTVNFYCPQVKDLDTEVIYKKYDPVFSINGIVNGSGIFEFDYSFEPPYNVPLAPFDLKDQILDLKSLDKDYWQRKEDTKSFWRKPACGAFYFHMDIWYRDTPWIARSEKEFLKYLKDYGGLSIYRDGINVFPAEWGAETDWLGLKQRQISQAKRLSYYHMIGNVEIDQTENPNLIDKTNREGLINNLAWEHLRRLVQLIVYHIEKDYMGKRDQYNILSGDLVREPRALRGFSKQSAKILSNINLNYDVALDQYKLFENIKDLADISQRKGKLVELSKSLNNLEGNLKQIQEVQDMLTEQAGFGLGIAVALHEVNKTTSNFYYGILEVLESGRFEQAKLESLRDTSQALESEILRLSPLRALRNEAPIQFRVSKSINYVNSVFKRRFKKLNIDFDYNSDVDFEIVARYGALNQILTNLFDNSCYWLDRPEISDKKIRIEINATERTIVVADNGPGIHESIMPYLFQPGYSMKWPPSGLGLYVCKHYMNLMKRRGDIYLAKERDQINGLNGAQFLLDFSKVISNLDDE